MISKVKFESLEQLLAAQELATKLNVDVGIHSDDGSIIDIKTFLGAVGSVIMKGSVNIVSESEEYHEHLKKLVHVL